MAEVKQVSASALAYSFRSRPVAMPFFRAQLAASALKRWAAERRTVLNLGTSLRVWVPLCAGGEDAYSVAMVLLEGFGSLWREVPLCVFATESDPDALSRARVGRYPLDAGRALSRVRRGRFFNEHAHCLVVRALLRDACRFTGHDLATSPHFNRLDLIVSRDALAALPPAARLDAIRFFHRALAPGGLLIDGTKTAALTPELFAARGRGGAFVARSGAKPSERASAAPDFRLRESEERFQRLSSQSVDAILVRDTESDRILSANAAAERLFGWSAAELLGMRGRDLAVSPESVRRAQNERRSPERLALPHFRRKDGTVFSADSTTSFLMMDGRPCRLDLTRDATPRLRGLAGGKREQERKDFVGEVVHELRSPIAVIRGSVETLRKGVSGGRARRSFLEFIEKHAGRMAALVDRLLDLDSSASAKRRVEPVPVLLAKALWEIVGSFIPVAKRRRITITIDIPAGLRVLADPADLPHVFGNLLDNAVKFTPRGGRIEVRGRSQGGAAVLSVRDNGGGVASGDAARLFERFFRGERTRRVKGTGLGLAIVRDIVTANHGRVSAGNDPAGGAIFTVTLPSAPEGEDD